MANRLLNDRNIDFLLYEQLDAEKLTALPHFREHTRETFDLYLGSVRKLARDVLFPAYRPLDEEPPVLVDGRVRVHPLMAELYPRIVELGVTCATRPEDVGGQQLPMLIGAMASAYLMAANLSAYGYVGLTQGAARLLESFGSSELKERYMARMYAGEWTGTMALTEPQAGSSLADVRCRAQPVDGSDHHLLSGQKIFISGGDHQLTENIVHMTLARIDGAPEGTRGVSLFAIPRLRFEQDQLVDNDVSAAGLIHKIGWKGLPSIALSLGERGDCHGYLVGEPHRGLKYMFQMMNEARLMVGMNAAATAAVAYEEALEYARERPQGRSLKAKDPSLPQLPIIEHADVRRMLLRQKAIVEGSFALLATTALYSDLAEHAIEAADRERAALLLDLLTPIAKSFPAEKGFDSNALAVQIHGGYGYSSEYLPEAWLRDQKLNTIHEGTTGIQSMDLLGRKVVAQGGRALQLLGEEIGATLERAKAAGVDPGWCDRLGGSVTAMVSVTQHLASLGIAGDPDAMLLHSVDYLDLAGTVVVAWQWLAQAAAAKERLPEASEQDRAFYEGKLCTAQYWINTELPRVGYLAGLCRSGEDSYGRMQGDWF